MINLNHKSMDKLNVYSYADIPRIMESSKDYILSLDLQFNDIRCIKSFQLFCNHENST